MANLSALASLAPFPALLTGLTALLLSAGLLRVLIRRQIHDIPNHRSSHTAPTPKGGGLAIVLALAGWCGWAAWQGSPANALPLATLGAATLLLSLVGLADDIVELSARLRLLVQLVLALCVVAVAARAPSPGVGSITAVALSAAGLLILLWSTNLYNFMDGIDGIAALQGILCGLGIFVMALLDLYPGNLAVTGLPLALACLAFAAFNFPPARMFMGDTGSAALGFFIAGVAVLDYPAAPDALWLWLILLAGFAADATATLLVRARRGESLTQAHRSHVYQLYSGAVQQRLLAAGESPAIARARAHRRCLGMLALVFCTWQAPIAALVGADALPGAAGALICLAPLMLAATVLGAGTEQLQDWRKKCSR